MLFRLIALLHLITPGKSIERNTIILSHQKKSANIEGQARYFVDKTASLNIKEIITAYNEGKFFESTTRGLNSLGESNTIWIGFWLKNKTGEPLFINFHNILIKDITVHAVDSISVGGQSSIGRALRQPPFQTRAYIFEIPNSTNAIDILVFCSLKVQAQPPLMATATVGILKELMISNRMREFLSVAIIGILLAMLFYNLSLLIVTQDILYLYYCFYLVASIINTFWINAYLFGWFQSSHPTTALYPWSMGLVFIAQLLFGNKMLRIRSRLPAVHNMSYILFAEGAGICLGPFFPLLINTILIFSCGIFQSLYFLLSIYLLFPKRDKLVYIFVLGWGPFLILTMLNTLMNLGAIPYTQFLDVYAVEVTIAWEVIIFSLALGYRYNLLRQERIKIQEENINIVNDQKITLKKMVLERTEEILAQNEQLIKSQSVIKVQNEKLVTQNKAYEKLRELVLKQNQNLELAVKKRTVDLANANHELKETLQKLERFSYITAHNLRGPLARILGLCMLLNKNESDKNNVNHEILDKLQVSAKELDIIIHDIGSILSVQNGTEDYEAINVNRTIHKVLDYFNKDLSGAKFQFNLNSDIETLTTIPQYFESIMSCLISNSIKYRNPNLSPKIILRIKKSKDQILIDYQDNGIGFDSERFKDKIFEPYQKFHSQNDGKGLGLFLVKNLVTAMNGSISLWSKISLGLRIRIAILDRANLTKSTKKSISKSYH